MHVSRDQPFQVCHSPGIDAVDAMAGISPAIPSKLGSNYLGSHITQFCDFTSFCSAYVHCLHARRELRIAPLSPWLPLRLAGALLKTLGRLARPAGLRAVANSLQVLPEFFFPVAWNETRGLYFGKIKR